MTLQLKLSNPTVAFSRDGTKIVAASGDGLGLKTWDASTGKSLITVSLLTNSDDLTAVLSNKWFASASANNSFQVWDISTGRCLKVFTGHNARVTSVAISKEGRWIASASWDKSIRLWDPSTGSVKWVKWDIQDWIDSIAFSGEGDWIASGSRDKCIRVWDTSMGKVLKTLKGHTAKINSVAFAVNVPHIVSGSDDMTVQLWDASTGNALRSLNGHSSPVVSVEISNNGAYIASSSSDRVVHIWDASTGHNLKTVLVDHDVVSVAFSKEATRVLVASDFESITVWNILMGAEAKAVTTGKRKSKIGSVVLSKHGTLVGFHYNDGSVHIWDTQEQQKLKAFQYRPYWGRVAFFNKSVAWVVFDSPSRELWSLNLYSGDAPVRIPDLVHAQCHIDASMDGSLLAIFGETLWRNDPKIPNGVQLWDVTNGVFLKLLTGHPNPVSAVAFSDNGQQIVSRTWDEIRIWDVSTGATLKVIREAPFGFLVAMTSDATRVVSETIDYKLHVWDVSTGQSFAVLCGHKDFLKSVTFGNNDRYIASGSADNTVRIWEVSTGMELRSLQGCHTDAVESVAFMEGGRSIISASKNGSVIIWELEGPTWYLADSNWILSPSTNDHLMWIPPEAHLIARPNCRIIFGESDYASINLNDAEIGPPWSKCYTAQIGRPIFIVCHSKYNVIKMKIC